LSSKEEHADAMATERARAAKQEYILKGPKANSWSATKPAYTYTSLCPDPNLKKSPRQRPEHPKGTSPFGSTEMICLICRKHWPINSGRKNCNCKGQGHLFSMGVYYQQKARGGS
jgi:hypothetical protein